jgi:hypothetical protein
MPAVLTVAFEVSLLLHVPKQPLVNVSWLPTHTESLPPKIAHCARAEPVFRQQNKTTKAVIAFMEDVSNLPVIVRDFNVKKKFV